MPRYFTTHSKNSYSQPSRSRVWIIFTSIAVLTAFFLLIILPYPNSWPGAGFFNKFYPHLGLDLQGGTHLVYEADTSQLADSEKSPAVEGVRDVIERRVNAYGVAEPLVQTTKTGSSYRVIIELAGVTDVNQAIKLIGETPLLEFKETDTAPTTVAATSTKEINDYNAAQEKMANDILSQVKKGGDFAALAQQYSEDESNAKDGGNLPPAIQGTFVPEFDSILFDKLKDGQIYPQLVKTTFGYHIIQRVSSETKDGQLYVTGRHILLKTKTLDNNNQLNWRNTALSGKYLKRAQVNFDPQTNVPHVTLTFNDDGAKLFQEITRRNVGKQVAIFLDGEIISAPTVQQEISGGSAIITGNFSLTEAKLLAQRLNAGALPVAIKLLSQQTIGPTLGKISLERSLIAGLIGLLIVCLFMIIFYRLPGIIAVIALVIYSIINYALYQMIPVTLSTAGIAGFILSIGMAVDANVLIFERTKEELRSGENLTQAIANGFSRAWSSIRDSNVSSLITTAMLFWFGSSIIKGFALTLGLGILISMFTAITVSRNLMQLIAPDKWLASRLWLMGVRKRKEE
ncbi:MAG: protein translocase subunit SecD [Candidatus Komeilibacteria bacterium]